MSNNRLAGDPSILIMGLISFFMSFSGYFLWGIPAFITLVLGIITWRKAKRDLKLFKQSPEAYDPKTYSTVRGGKIMGILGIIFSFFIICFWLFIFWLGYGDNQVEFLDLDINIDLSDTKFFSVEQDTITAQDSIIKFEDDDLILKKDSLNISE